MYWKFSLLLTMLVEAMEQCQTSRDIPLLAESPLRVCSFNIRVFGMSKIKKTFRNSDTKVTDILVKILLNYDIATVQEIRDSSEEAFPFLVKLMNEELHKRLVAEGKDPLSASFGSAVSARLGRTNSKEQYGFIFREDRVTLKDTFQYQDGENELDVFEREPFAALFESKTSGVEQFSMISVHTQPGAAKEEVDKLTAVYEAVKNHWNNENCIIAGDFNSGCNYVRPNDWKEISLFTDKRFKWIIGDCVDTTVNEGTACAYDRFVIAGSSLQKVIVPGSAVAVPFDQQYGLTYKEALKVSDHYPIQMLISGKVIRGVQTRIDSYQSFCVSEYSHTSQEALKKLKSKSKVQGFSILVTEVKGDPYEIIAHRIRVNEVADAMLDFHREFPNVISEKLVRGFDSYARTDSFVSPPYVYGLKASVRATYEIEIRCKFAQPYECFASAYHQTS